MSSPLWPIDNLNDSSESTGWITMGSGGDPIQFDNASGNDWARLTAGREPFSYRVEAVGSFKIIRFRGSIQKSDNTAQAFGSPIVTMPAGLRIAAGVKTFIVPLVQNTLSLRAAGQISVFGQDTGFPGALRFVGPNDSMGVTDLDVSSIAYLVDA